MHNIFNIGLPESGAFAFLGAYFAVTMLISLAVAVVGIIVVWRIYEKAGEHGWAAIIPVYNVYVLYKITWGTGWMFLLMLIPVVNVVIGIITMLKLAKVFGKSTAFGVGLIFLNFIFEIILAFDSSVYLGTNVAK